MSRFRHALQDRDQHIRSLRIISAVLAGFLLLACMVDDCSQPSDHFITRRICVPAVPVRGGKFPRQRLSFAFFNIFQQLNAWPKNGEVDYSAKIHALSAYLTPSCRELMEGDARRRKDAGELLDRVRVVYEIPEHGYGGRYNKNPVTVQGRDNWLVRLDLVADEQFDTEPVKRALVRYPLKVVRWEGDPGTESLRAGA
ncbi:PFL_4703 family integrating conjugative element protein [Escherichia coli]